MSKQYIGYEAVNAYFRDAIDTINTYPHFLLKLQDVILKSPPFTEDWGGLDGIWYERYIREAKNSNKKRHPHVSMKSFFENIIWECKKRMVQNHYMMSSIDILDEVRKCGSQEIISDVEEAIKTKSTKGHSNKNSASSERMLTPECTDDDDLKEMTVLDYEKYKKAYAKMNNEKKWILTTGKIIEDALYNFGLHCSFLSGQQFEGQNGTKLLQERGLKMPKMLKDMFDQLCMIVEQDECKIRKLETIGFLHSADDSEEDQLQRLQDACDTTLPPPQK
nr:6969_t:CDS:2 [Entrophospora candida]